MVNNDELKKELKQLQQEEIDRKEALVLQAQIKELKENQREKSFFEKFIKYLWNKI